jgi:hypothetical protein
MVDAKDFTTAQKGSHQGRSTWPFLGPPQNPPIEKLRMHHEAHLGTPELSF